MRKDKTHLRNTVVKTKLTLEEKEKLDRLCEANGLSLSGYIRQAVFTGKVISRKPPGACDERLLESAGQLVSEYGKIGSNLNQIARHLNGGGSLDEEMAALLRKISTELELLKHRVLRLMGNAYGHDKTH